MFVIQLILLFVYVLLAPCLMFGVEGSLPLLSIALFTVLIWYKLLSKSLERR